MHQLKVLRPCPLYPFVNILYSLQMYTLWKWNENTQIYPNVCSEYILLGGMCLIEVVTVFEVSYLLCLVVVLCICASVRGVVIISVIDFSSFQGVIGRLPCIMTFQVLTPSQYDAIQSANMLDLVLYIWIWMNDSGEGSIGQLIHVNCLNSANLDVCQVSSIDRALWQC